MCSNLMLLTKDGREKLFGVLETLLIIIGSLVGGVVGVLLPKISLGMTLGFVFGLLINLV
jgi:hypothetical protein